MHNNGHRLHQRLQGEFFNFCVFFFTDASQLDFSKQSHLLLLLALAQSENDMYSHTCTVTHGCSVFPLAPVLPAIVSRGTSGTFRHQQFSFDGTAPRKRRVSLNQEQDSA